MPKILTFGEIMLRLTTPGYQRFSQAPHFEATLGGAEANVAVAIATLGGSAGFLSRLPGDNDLAERAMAELRGLGVEVGAMMRGGERLGLYFLEQGISQRAGKVIYDRAHSSMATARPEDFDWDRIFTEEVRWFHWSGITPALSPAAPEIIREACAAARARGMTISFDLNYRGKLWSLAQAGEVLAPLMSQVDLCVTSAEEAKAVFGIELPEGARSRAAEQAEEQGLAEVPPDRDVLAAQELMARFGFQSVALTQRTASTAESTEWSAFLHHAGEQVQSRRHEVSTIVDRLGAGDSFSGALILALSEGEAPQRAVDFAVAASALKHTIHGDFNRVTREEVEATMSGASGGRVRR